MKGWKNISVFSLRYYFSFRSANVANISRNYHKSQTWFLVSFLIWSPQVCSRYYVTLTPTKSRRIRNGTTCKSYLGSHHHSPQSTAFSQNGCSSIPCASSYFSFSKTCKICSCSHVAGKFNRTQVLQSGIDKQLQLPMRTKSSLDHCQCCQCSWR